MTNKLHLIYVPGLGDDNPSRQAMLVKSWRWWGVESELFQMKWSDDKPWQAKFGDLLARIDELVATGKSVALVGASAGGSAVINAYAERQNDLVGVVIIAGKVNRPDAIGQRYRQNNPSFIDSAKQSATSLSKIGLKNRRRILSKYAAIDEVVTKKDSYIEGARNQRVFIVGHVIVIATQLFFGAPSFIRFLKRLSK